MGADGVKTRAVPVAGVSVTLKTVTLKESREGFGGGVSATRVRLTVAVPPTLQLTLHMFCGPLQEARDKVARKRVGRTERDLLRFIWPPSQNNLRSPSLAGKTLTIPPPECNAAGERKDG